jgi:hypothetical protein
MSEKPLFDALAKRCREFCYLIQEEYGNDARFRMLVVEFRADDMEFSLEIDGPERRAAMRHVFIEDL